MTMSPDVEPPLVSIVTPVYNGEKYLRECIESVLVQTYTRWHYVIVDNCSTDRTFEIASEYAARDPRIRVVRNQQFARVVKSYNIALRQTSADSAYTKVVAADDWLFPECLERMVALAEAHPRVAIVGAYQLAGTGVAFPGLPYPIKVISGPDVCRMQLMGGPYVFGTPTSVLLRSDIVRSREAFYNESNLHADDEACVEFLQHHDFGFVHQILTFRRDNEGSLTSVSQRLNTSAPGLLLLLVKYGSRYLTPEELNQRIAEVLAEYYWALGKDLLKCRDRKFWRYHRAKLAELGYPLSKLRLAVAALAVATDLLLNPKHSLETVFSRSQRGTRHAGFYRTDGRRSIIPVAGTASPASETHEAAAAAPRRRPTFLWRFAGRL
jgi:glycosyltransferase involved in cell wall biosynthesis